MEKIKWLDGNFMEVETLMRNVCYGILENGDVEFYTPYDTAYPIISAEEILKLAEILKEG